MKRKFNGYYYDRGRVYVHCLFHPRMRKDGFVRRAVLVAEQKIGRFLRPGEVAHHINGIKDDDTIENIEALGRKEHLKLHHTSEKGRPFYGNQYTGSLKNSQRAEG